MKTLQYEKRVRKDLYQYRLKDSLALLPYVHDGGGYIINNPSGGGSVSTTFNINPVNGIYYLISKGSAYNIITSTEISSYLAQGYKIISQSNNRSYLNALIPANIINTQGQNIATQGRADYLPYLIGGGLILALIL